MTAADTLRTALLGRRVGTIFTVDDVRPELAADNVTGNAIGAVFRHAIQEGWLTPVGYAACRERSARGRVVRQYRRRALGPQGMYERAARTEEVLFT